MLCVRRAVCLLLAMTACVCAGAELDVWPRPLSVSNVDNTTATALGEMVWGVQFTEGGAQQEGMVLAAVERAMANIQAACLPHVLDIFNEPRVLPSPTTQLTSGAITVQRGGVALAIGVDESYTLDVDGEAGAVRVTAATAWGALHAIETFSQMVQHVDAKGGGVCGVPFVSARVADEPRYAWRGLLVDTARHFLSLDTIRRCIDALSYNKMNVLHWHMTDAESFPFGSERLPELPARGAYAPDAVYSIAQINAIEQYALERGVLVMPELDVPGHTASWVKSYPNNVADCWKELREHYGGELVWPSFDSVALDPSVNTTYELVAELVEELSEVFSSDFLHMGGDEVRFSCWAAVPRINDWMREEGFVNKDGELDYAAVQSMFESRVEEMVTGQGRRTVLWEEAYVNSAGMDPSTVVNVWTNASVLADAVRDGLDVVMSWGWYLDRQAPTCSEPLCKTHWMWMWTWHDFYQVEIDDWLPKPAVDGDGTVLGGEASMWGESINDGDIMPMIWGRTPAVAERLWSAKNVTDIQDAQNRLSSFACRLKRRGISAAPSEPDYCPLREVDPAPPPPTPAIPYAPTEGSTGNASGDSSSSGGGGGGTWLPWTLAAGFGASTIALFVALMLAMRKVKRDEEYPVLG